MSNEQFKQLLERRPYESLMDHAVRLFLDDPTGQEAAAKAETERHIRETHKLWMCPGCKSAITVCAENPAHTPLTSDLLHSWVPTEHPNGSIVQVLHCSKQL